MLSRSKPTNRRAARYLHQPCSQNVPAHCRKGPLSRRCSPPLRRRLYSTLVSTEPAKLAGNQEYKVKQAGKLSKQAHTRAGNTGGPRTQYTGHAARRRTALSEKLVQTSSCQTTAARAVCSFIKHIRFASLGNMGAPSTDNRVFHVQPAPPTVIILQRLAGSKWHSPARAHAPPTVSVIPVGCKPTRELEIRRYP